MKSMQLAASATCVCVASLLSGCYSPETFQSPHADILVASLNPKYLMFFKRAELASGTNEYRYEFSNQPRMLFYLHLILPSRDDEERLKARNAQIAVDVTDSHGRTAYAREWSVYELVNPRGASLFVLPPDGWCSEPKGNVVPSASQKAYPWRRRQDRSNARSDWFYGVPDMGLVYVCRMRLDSKDYRLRMTITLDDADEPPIYFHVSLSAGWYASL